MFRVQFRSVSRFGLSIDSFVSGSDRPKISKESPEHFSVEKVYNLLLLDVYSLIFIQNS